MCNDLYFLQTAPLRATTLLYGLPLRGRGTGDVESLFSYLLALSVEHSASASNLVNDVLPSTEAFASSEARLGWGWDRAGGSPMVGMGNNAGRWARILEEATCQSGLQFATLTGLKRHVCGIGLVDSQERVCLHCIRQDQALGQRPYGRLLWRLAAVKCCPEHRNVLVPTRCSRAFGPRRGHATFRSRKPGQCLQCGCVGFECVLPSAETVSDADVWRANACRQLLERLPDVERADPLAMKDSLIAHCSRLDGKSALARRVGATKSSISRWLSHRTARFSLPQLLDIAVSEGFQLHRMLLGDLGQDQPAPTRDPVRVRRAYRYLDHHELEQGLVIAIRNKRSLPEVARRLKVDQTSLAKHRRLYIVLRDQHRQRRDQADVDRQDDAIRQAAEVARQALIDGRSPSLRRASELTGTQWRSSQLRASALNLIRIELGDPMVSPPVRASVFSTRFRDRVAQAAKRLEAEIIGTDWQLAA